MAIKIIKDIDSKLLDQLITFLNYHLNLYDSNGKYWLCPTWANAYLINNGVDVPKDLVFSRIVFNYTDFKDSLDCVKSEKMIKLISDFENPRHITNEGSFFFELTLIKWFDDEHDRNIFTKCFLKALYEYKHTKNLREGRENTSSYKQQSYR